MGVLYDIINKGITDEEISICYKEMKCLEKRINDVLSPEQEIIGLNIVVANINTYVVTIKRYNNELVVFSYSTERGTLAPISGFKSKVFDEYLFCKDIKGQLFNTIKLLSKLKHRQTSITLKTGDASNAYVYGSTLTIIENKKDTCKFDKLVLKSTSKDYESLMKL